MYKADDDFLRGKSKELAPFKVPVATWHSEPGELSLRGCKKLAGTAAGVERHDVRAMLEYLLLLLSLLGAIVRDHEAVGRQNLARRRS